MATHSLISRPFPRGFTAAGEEIFILTWRDLEFFSQVHVKGEWYRTYCPIHGSDHQRSLSIKAATGFGHCFSCEARVFVADFDPQIATRLQRRRYHSGSRHEPSHRTTPVYSQKLTLQDWQAQECQLLHTLQAKGALRLDRDAAWNAQAYLEARHIPLEIAIKAGVGYLEPGASTLYGQRFLQRWEDRLIFPLSSPASSQSDQAGGFAGRLLWLWQCCPDEIAHKRSLEQQDRKRWIKTNPAGWFWEPEWQSSVDPVIVVEGPFDRLALLATGDFHPEEVIALVGTALQPDWLSGIQRVLLALDDDQGGREASGRIQQSLVGKPIQVEACLTTSEGGKDWSERWRRLGSAGLDPLYACQALLAHDL